MKWFFIPIMAALVFAACKPLMSESEAAVENQTVNELLTSGEITQQQATWRRADIARMQAFNAFDIGSAETIIGLLVSSVGASLGLTRLQRGAAKPIAKANVLSFQRGVKANGA